MQLRINVLAVFIAISLCHITLAAPSVRVKRAEELTLDPVNLIEAEPQEIDREKRKLPEAAFQSKNAVLGFVFGKIDSFIDAKTRFIDRLDKTNIEKNKAAGIEAPKAIPNFQALISGIITPKIAAVSQKFAGLSGGLSSGVLGGSSGSSSGGASGNSNASASSGDDDDEDSSPAPASGLSSILSTVLRLSGPILSASIGGGGSSGGIAAGSDTTVDPDDDF